MRPAGFSIRKSEGENAENAGERVENAGNGERRTVNGERRTSERGAGRLRRQQA